MASTRWLARLARSITPGRQPGASAKELKQLLQEVKLLYLRRRYKQCTAKATEILRQFEGQLHSLHESYLHYYTAAAYETLGHIAHNYSSNKIPILYMAKDYYVACNAALENALAEFEQVQNKLGCFVVDEDDDDDDDGGDGSVSPTVTCLHYLLTSEDAPEYPRDSYTTATYGDTPDMNRDNKIIGDNLCAVQDNPFRDSLRCYSSQTEGNPDPGSASDDGTKLMPPPLRIRKAPAAHHDLRPESPTPQLYRRSMPPLPGPLSVAPLFSGSSTKSSRPSLSSCPGTERKPLETHPATTTPISNNSPTSAITAATTPLTMDAHNSALRITEQIISLATQLTANIDSITTLIEKTAELQRIHKAGKIQRLASFWSFNPVLPSGNTTISPQDNNSSRTSRTSRTSSAKSKQTSASGCSSHTSVSTGGDPSSNSNGRVIDDCKRERIERLRAENWKTVGLKSSERGWKGSEYYERLCGVALAELYGR